jgi:uncharacterized damage-inducible protein DinB
MNVDSIRFNQQCWADEYERFRKTIAAVASDQLDWRPDPVSRSTRALIGHMIGHIQDVVELAADGVINHRNQVPFGTLDDALQLFDDAYDEMQAKLQALDDEGWSRPADFKLGDHLIMTAPVEQLSWLMLFDSIHHRGQLTTHFRPTGRPVPSLYGPSADEEASGH